MYSINRSTQSLCLLILVLISFSQALLGYPVQYENQFVEKIDICTNTFDSQKKYDLISLKSRLKTQQGQPFSQSQFDADIKLLSQEFGKVEPVISATEEGLRIKLKVWAKPVIRSICWEGNCKISAKDLASELGICRDSVFDRHLFNQAVRKVQAYYVKQGFFEADINYEMNYDECSNQVDVVINICEGRSGRIKNILFCNFTDCEEKELSEMLVTKRYIFLTSWLTGEGTYQEEAIQHDKMVILSYLQNKGYADADVEIRVCELPNYPNRVAIKIIAYKGEVYRLGRISFSGNCLFSNEQITAALNLYSQDPFSPEELHLASQRVTKLYGRGGYIDAFVNFETQLRSDCDLYDVHFTIEEGEQSFVGLIKVFGNCVTQTRVILNETLLVPGHVFDSEALCKTQERLRNIGYFKKVNVYTMKGDTNSVLPSCYRNVHIEVEEDSTGNIGLSGGFSTMESAFLGLNLTERNFNYRGISDIFDRGFIAVRGGGEYAYLNFTVGSKSRRGVLSWTKPFFQDTLWSVGFDLEGVNNRYVSTDYDINSIGLTLHGTYDINAFVKTGVHYRIRHTHIVPGADASRELVHEAKHSGLISAVGASWMYDSTNHPQFPTDGFRSKLEGECAGIGGKQSFLTFGYLNSWYMPMAMFHPKGYFVFRADFKFALPYGHTSADEMPLEERLFLGGEHLVRGYRPYSLGPKFEKVDDINPSQRRRPNHSKINHKRKKTTNQNTSAPSSMPSPKNTDKDKKKKDKEEPTGGLSLQYYSFEYDHPFSKKVQGFAFADCGQISARRLSFGHLYVSTGVGVRLKLIESMPPITLGIGFPVNAKDRSDVKRFFFDIGGRF